MRAKSFRWTVGVLLAALAAGGCAPSASRKQLAQLEGARAQMDKSQYVLAANGLTDFMGKAGGSVQAGEAYYLRGLCYRQMGVGKDAAARADFTAAVKKAGGQGAIGRYAHIALGHMAFEATPANYEQAIKHYQAGLKGLADKPPKDAALFRLATALQRTGHWADADLYLSKCFNAFGSSPFAATARREFGARAFRLQVGAFGETDSAKRAAAELGQRGWPADWTALERETKVIYAVRTGRYQTYAQAERALAEFKRIKPAAIIVAAQPSK